MPREQRPEPLDSMHRLPKRPNRPAPTCAGFSLLESVIGMSVVVIGLMAMTSTSLVVHSLEESDKARRLAGDALQAVIEEVHAVSTAAVEDEDGWAATLLESYGAGGDPGTTFPVPDLTPWEGEAEVGSIQVVTDETLGDRELGAPIGMPRDLNGDGLVTDNDVSGNANLLPAVVRLRWTGESGDREVVHGFYVMGI